MNFDETEIFDTLPDTSEEPKKVGGRPLVPADNFLRGSLNYLADIFEKGWAFIGWELGCIRNARKECSLADIRAAIAPAKELGQGVICLLLPESVEESDSRQLSALRKELGRATKAEREAREAVRQQSDQCREVEQALLQATGRQRAVAKEERKKRKARLRRLQKSLSDKQEKMASVDRTLRAQEAFFAQSEMLDFVRSRKYELNPRNLAAALAGLAYIRWEASMLRCQKFRDSIGIEHSYYSAFRAISYLIRDDRPRSPKKAIDFFRDAIPKLPSSHERGKVFLAGYWFQFKKSVESEWKRCPHPRRLPYDLTAALVRTLKQPMSAIDNVIAAQDALTI